MRQRVNSKCLCGSGKKYKKCCNGNVQNIQNIQNVQNLFNSERHTAPYLIEGTLRLQENLVTAKSRYGSVFNGKIINTKYFGDDEDIPTLVCSNDLSLILGKPRYAEHFTEEEYIINVINNNHTGLLSIEISNIPKKINVTNVHNYIPPKTPEQAAARAMLDAMMKNIKEDHCKVCGDTEKDGVLLKIPTNVGDIFLCEYCYSVQSKM